MPAFGRIIGAACEYGTEAIRNVSDVNMLESHNL